MGNCCFHPSNNSFLSCSQFDRNPPGLEVGRNQLLTPDLSKRVQRVKSTATQTFNKRQTDMSIRRIFMDWNQPAIQNAVDYLTKKYFNKTRHRIEMDNVLIVVPGSRAGRRIFQRFAEKASQWKAVLFPPRIQTAGHLPENLYQPKRPFANELVQHLAWVEAIKALKNRAKKYFPHLPETKQTIDWLDLAALLSKVHRELAADGLNFNDVVTKGAQLKGFAEKGRWRLLSSIQEKYLSVLDDLKLWDLQTARLVAIRERECETNDEIYLLATADLNQATRQMIDQVSHQVTALIHAPDDEALGFDEHGCLDAEYWKHKQIPLADEQTLVADQPSDQADAVCHLLGQWGDKYSSEDIVVGAPSADLAPFVERKLSTYQQNSHWAVGRSLRESSVFKLLEAICGMIEKGRYPDFAILFRHPDVENWLSDKARGNSKVSADKVISECDQYYAKHLVPHFEKWLGKTDQFRSLKWAVDTVNSVMAPLRRKPLLFTEWIDPILDLVGEFYSSRTFDLNGENDAGAVKALSQIRSILETFQEIPAQLNVRTTAVNTLRLLLQNMSSQTIPEKSKLNAIELLGWLELPLDVAPAVIVTNFNEGSIPESQNADMFLPDGLRSVLGLNDNKRRYARDAYALSTLVHSKSDLRMIVGKRDLSGDPMTPSRLFFACNRESIAHRVMRFSKPKTFDISNVKNETQMMTESAFAVPIPDTSQIKIESISVTSFSTYLKCPYRFYLQRVLKLKSINDEVRELDGMFFGNILHDIFCRFGENRVRLSENETEISDYLFSELDSMANEEFGQKRLPAIEIQLQQMRFRLKGFAKWQAERTKKGWEIHFVEKKSHDPRGVPFQYDDEESIFLKGTIDRIDFHPQSQIWQILDYKTGDRGDSPNQTHQHKGNWIDLQLPLYRHIAKSFEVDGTVQLGYIVIPKKIDSIGAILANWTDADLEGAYKVARDCSRRIVNHEFWEPTLPPPPFAGREFAPICQDDVFQPQLATELEYTGTAKEAAIGDGGAA